MDELPGDTPSLGADVKMQHILSCAEPGVKGYGRFINMVCLDVDDVGTKITTQALQRPDQCRSDPATPVRLCHGQVVNIDLAPGLLEFLQHVSGQSADDRTSIERGKCNESAAGQEVDEVPGRWLVPAVCGDIIEGVTEHGQQGSHLRDVVCRKSSNIKLSGHDDLPVPPGAGVEPAANVAGDAC